MSWYKVKMPLMSIAFTYTQNSYVIPSKVYSSGTESEKKILALTQKNCMTIVAAPVKWNRLQLIVSS